MFRRRAEKPLYLRVLYSFWPKNGWRRGGRYIWHRLHRLPGSPYSIAAGLATGAAFSVTPLIGIHFFLAALFAWAIRGNVVASAVGTVIGNPWTFPVIWISTYQVGRFILGQEVPLGTELDFTAMFMGLLQSMIEADATIFLEEVWPIWFVMAVGCIPFSIATWVGVYIIFYRLTERYQERRNRNTGRAN